MPQKSDAPLVNSGASRNSCGGWFRDFPSFLLIQTQFLITAHSVRPEVATMLAALAIGEGSSHG